LRKLRTCSFKPFIHHIYILFFFFLPVANFQIIFDDFILHQLKKEGNNKQKRELLSKIFDNIEDKGPDAGKLVDSHLFIYEMKLKRPPLRLYFKHIKYSNQIYLFQYEMKTSEEKQKKTVHKLIEKARNLFSLKP